MNKKRFQCRIGIHDWQPVEDSAVKCDNCNFCAHDVWCRNPLTDKVCIAPGCRAMRLKATNHTARKAAAKALRKDRKLLAKMKLELIKDEGA